MSLQNPVQAGQLWPCGPLISTTRCSLCQDPIMCLICLFVFHVVQHSRLHGAWPCSRILEVYFVILLLRISINSKSHRSIPPQVTPASGSFESQGPKSRASVHRCLDLLQSLLLPQAGRSLSSRGLPYPQVSGSERGIFSRVRFAAQRMPNGLPGIVLL